MPRATESTRRRLAGLALLVTGSLLAGCEASVSVNLAASHFGDADQLVLALDGIDLLDEDGSTHELDSSTSAQVDAFDYADGDTLALVDQAKVAQGRYTGLRLRFGSADSLLYTVDGAQYPIDVSNLGFAQMDVELGENEQAEQLVVLETRFSLYPSSSDAGRYVLTPVLRVVHPERAGSISGSVDAALIQSDACRQSRTLGSGVAVYAFSGSNVTPRDYVQNQGGSPVAAVDVTVSSDAASFRFDFPYLAAGNYTLAVTCNADSENPNTDDGLVFLAQTSVVLAEAESESVLISE